MAKIIKLEDVLNGLYPTYNTTRLKVRLVETGLKKWECEGEECGLKEWKGKSLVLQLDHIDGDDSNHRFSNLRLLCPNCHSQTNTFGFKNKGKGNNRLIAKFGSRKKYVEESRKLNDLYSKEIIQQLLISNIDFSKFGWCKPASEIIKLTPQKVNNWMKRFMPEFYKIKCFKRKRHRSLTSKEFYSQIV